MKRSRPQDIPLQEDLDLRANFWVTDKSVVDGLHVADAEMRCEITASGFPKSKVQIDLVWKDPWQGYSSPDYKTRYNLSAFYIQIRMTQTTTRTTVKIDDVDPDKVARGEGVVYRNHNIVRQNEEFVLLVLRHMVCAAVARWGHLPPGQAPATHLLVNWSPYGEADSLKRLLPRAVGLAELPPRSKDLPAKIDLQIPLDHLRNHCREMGEDRDAPGQLKSLVRNKILRSYADQSAAIASLPPEMRQFMGRPG